MNVREKYKDNIFHVDSIDDIPLDKVHVAMKRDTFAAIRGVVKPDEIKRAKELLTKNFSIENDRPTTGEHPSEIQGNFQKMLVGGVTKKYNSFPRFFRTFYNPVWAEDLYGMRDIFKRVGQVRNLLMGKPLNYAIDSVEENGLWMASRIHHYPQGGGFFVSHRDTTLIDVAQEKRTDFYQILILMSEKGEGKEFERGGAFVDRDDERVYLEDLFMPGDIGIYDGSTVHGVEDIDPHKRLEVDKISGRLAGFVSLYKEMKESY